ncbi:flocculation protein FLO11-like [Pecten maximus]|uniref:flocculation protein FLO11-like n=1 Tax=Pecten maximus TaxID=6579 RepID=UPI001457EBEB|nr:flocculation protein FLO11-like [Pecten maximus]
MDLTLQSVCILCAYLGFVKGHFDSSPGSEDETIPIDITYKHGITDRNLINVMVTSQGGSDVISLRLSRVKRSLVAPSLLVVTDGGLEEDVFGNSSTRLQSEKMFYKDDKNTSAFSIGWKDGQISKVHGHFVRDGFLHSVLSRDESGKGQGSSRSSENTTHGFSRSSDVYEGRVPVPHMMTKYNSTIAFSGDAIQFNESKVFTKENRRKRQSVDPQHLFVEYVVVTDHKNYLKWNADVSGHNMTSAEKDLTTKYNMLEFYQHVVHGIDVIFKTLSTQDLQVEIVLTGLVICNESNICPWSEKNKICADCDTVDDKECLFDFSKWRQNVLGRLLDHDHATLFTGYDLYYSLMQSKKTVGLAYMSNMCQNGSVSLVEERRNALSIHIAAHELGHSFGSNHDGNVLAEACPAEDKYLMAPSMLGVTDPAKASHPWGFSPCSRADIYDYINSLDRNGMNCMQNIPSIYTPGQSNDGAGLAYLPDDQCQAQYGKQSAVCREYHVGAWRHICYSMACRIPGKGECTLIYPHDGTPCGNMRWCQQGNCVYSGNTRSVDELCPLGDDPNYACTLSDCDSTIHMRAHCCQTCQHVMSVAITTTPVTMTTDDATKTSTDISDSNTTTTPKNTTVAMTTPIVTTTISEPTKLTVTDVAKNATTGSMDTTTSDSDTVAMTTTSVRPSISPVNITSPTTITLTSSSTTKNKLMSSNQSLSTSTSQLMPSTTSQSLSANQSDPVTPITSSAGTSPNAAQIDLSDSTGGTSLPAENSPRSTFSTAIKTTTTPLGTTETTFETTTKSATTGIVPKITIKTIQTTVSAEINKTTVHGNGIRNQTIQSASTSSPAPNQFQTSNNSPATSSNLHSNTTVRVSSTLPPNNTRPRSSPEPVSKATDSTFINNASTKTSTIYSTQIPTSIEASTDSPVNATISTILPITSSTVSKSTNSIRNVTALTTDSTLSNSTDDVNIQQTTPRASYDVTDVVFNSTKPENSTVNSIQNSTTLPNNDTDIIDKSKLKPNNTNIIGTKKTTILPFDSTTEGIQEDVNTLNAASNICNSNNVFIITTVTLIINFSIILMIKM